MSKMQETNNMEKKTNKCVDGHTDIEIDNDASKEGQTDKKIGRRRSKDRMT